MPITKINQAGLKHMRKCFGFNSRLTSVSYDKKINLLTFEFCPFDSEISAKTETDCFEMSKSYCDYHAFERFACCCFDAFNPEMLTDDEIITKSSKLYHATLKLLKKPGPFNRLLNSHQTLHLNLMAIIKTDLRSTNFCAAL